MYVPLKEHLSSTQSEVRQTISFAVTSCAVSCIMVAEHKCDYNAAM